MKFFYERNRREECVQQRIRRRRGGSALIEFALVLPPLAMITFGLIQYGLVLNARLSLFHVSRAASRYAAVNASRYDADTLIKQRTVELGRGFKLNVKPENVWFTTTVNGVTVTSPQNDKTLSYRSRKRWDSLTMKITVDISDRMFLPKTFFGAPMPGTAPIETSSVFVIENDITE